MRNLKECQAEVFRRSEKRINERKQCKNHILMACIPLILCVTVFGTFILPKLYQHKTAPGIYEDRYCSAMGAAGTTDVYAAYLGAPTAKQEGSGIIIASLFLGVGALAMGGIVVKEIKNRFAPVKTVKAVVIDKHKTETFSKYSGNGKQEKYVVVFSVNGRKKAFYVSQFSYGGYRINEKGTLTYKGSRLVDFR